MGTQSCGDLRREGSSGQQRALKAFFSLHTRLWEATAAQVLSQGTRMPPYPGCNRVRPLYLDTRDSASKESVFISQCMTVPHGVNSGGPCCFEEPLVLLEP